MENYWKPFQHKLSSILLCLLAISIILILFVLHSSNSFTVVSPGSSSSLLENSASASHHQNYSNLERLADKSGSINSNAPAPSPSKREHGNQSINRSQDSVGTSIAVPSSHSDLAGIARPTTDTACNLFQGKWVRDPRGSIYTNVTCPTMPDVRNCGRHGKEQDYVYWRWKPDGCELPMFDPEMFLKIARGKKLMFIGDSLARNQMESMLCLLSQAETPIDTYKDDNDKHRTWYFPAHNFTLMVIWTEFLVESAEIIVNGTPSNTFSINLDRMNPVWAHKLPELQYAVINHGNWFTRRTYIHKRGKLMGCVHCYKEKIPSISVTSAIRMVFRAAFDHINKCKQCEDLLTIMRTYSMSHFEHGSWFSGGYCNRTRPLSEGDLRPDDEAWEFRKIQMEEMWRAKGEGKRRIELMDVTFSMMLRADAHPGTHWVAKVTSDCLHWCLPGPIDMWNELLLEILKKNT